MKVIDYNNDYNYDDDDDDSDDEDGDQYCITRSVI